MERMWNFEVLDRALQRLDDLARGEAVEGDHIVEPECPDIVFERRRTACIDAFDPEAIACGKDRCNIIRNRRWTLSVTQQRQQEIVIPEDGENPLVDDWNVRELKMRLERLMRDDCRLDYRGEAHRRVKGARFEGRPFGRGKGQGGRIG